MKSIKWWIYISLTIGIVVIVIWVTTQGVKMETATVVSGAITEAVEDSGTVKSHHSQTVYIESSGRIVEVLVEKGDLIQQGTLLLKLDPTDQQLAELALHQTQNNYELAQKDYDKMKNLYAAGVISRKEYETIETDYKNAVKSYLAAKLRAEKSTESTLLRAPRDGVILDRLVEANFYASEGTAAFVIGALSDLEIEAEILADDAVNVRPGNLVIITGKATGTETLKGMVTEVAPMAKNVVSSLGVNQKRRTVTITLRDGNGKLQPGVDIDVKIITQVKQNALRVPLSAIFDYQGETCVFLIKDNKTKIRPVHTGIENNEAVEIQTGLKSGDLVLARPDNNVKEGVRIKLPKKL